MSEEQIQNSRANWSIGLGIAGLVCWIIPIIGLPVAITGIIKGTQAKEYGGPIGARASTGVVLCAVGIGLSLISAVIGLLAGM